MIFYRISELMSATLIQRLDKKSFHFKNKRPTEILKAFRYKILKIVLILYIYLLNLSWLMKCLFLRNKGPFTKLFLLYYTFPTTYLGFRAAFCATVFCSLFTIFVDTHFRFLCFQAQEPEMHVHKNGGKKNTYLPLFLKNNKKIANLKVHLHLWCLF